MNNNPIPVFHTLPKHIAIIMDGNGRWAKANGKERLYGHQMGVETVRKIVETAAATGIEFLSLFAFSVENWKRPQEEVDALMELLVIAIEREIEALHKNNIRLLTLGNITMLPKHCIESIEKSTLKTAANTGMTLCIALSYSGRWDIMQAVKKTVQAVNNEQFDLDNLTEIEFSQFLVTANIPDPELMIRTSGESRISNFFLWQCAYTELYFTHKFWPEFAEEDFYDALNSFQNRERRFGKISEQLK